MRDYPNGGFFFIDAAPIQAAGENGLHIEGIFEDAKRAIESGKVFVITGAVILNVAMSGIIATAYQTADGITITKQGETSIDIYIAENDVVTFSVD